MSLLLLPFFLVALVVTTFPDLVRLIMARFQLRTPLLALSLLGLSAISGNLQPHPSKTATTPLISVNNLPLQLPPNRIQTLKNIPSREELARLQALLRLSMNDSLPTSDSLINLGILAWWQENYAAAETYWQAAQQLDPSNEVLSPFSRQEK